MPNLFPEETKDLSTAVQPVTPTKFGRSWRFDFDRGEFVLTPTGRVATAEGVDAWVEWCRKALMTERYRYLVYSRNYGQEFDGLIGRALTRAAAESEIQRMVRECLLADPRTKAVDEFKFTWDEGQVVFTCVASNVLDESATIQGSAVIE